MQFAFANVYSRVVPLGAAVAVCAATSRRSQSRPARCVGWADHGGQPLASQFPVSKLLGAPDPTGDACGDGLAKLREVHRLSEEAYGRLGERGAHLWHRQLYAWGAPCAALEAVHPCAFLLCLGHAGLSCLMGVPIDGQAGSPSPSSLVLAHLGQDSVGKSKHTTIIRRLLAAVEDLAKGGLGVHDADEEDDDDDDADHGVRRADKGKSGKSKALVDMVPQVFTGSGLLKVCGPNNLHRSPMFVLDEGLGALTQLGLTGAPDKVSDMVFEYQAMFTSLWSTGTFRKDLAKGVYHLPWACPSLHMNIHPSYWSKVLTNQWGRDCTAVRRRFVLYSFPPFFPHHVQELWDHLQAAKLTQNEITNQ